MAHKISGLAGQIAGLREALQKQAFVPMPPDMAAMAQQQQMMQGGGGQGGMPPGQPGMPPGMPMDPSMGGMPPGMPMDPSMGGMPPGQPGMDPSMMGGQMPQQAPPTEDTGQVMEEIIGAMGGVEEALGSMSDTIVGQDERIAQLEAALQQMGSQMTSITQALQDPSPAPTGMGGGY